MDQDSDNDEAPEPEEKKDEEKKVPKWEEIIDESNPHFKELKNNIEGKKENLYEFMSKAYAANSENMRSAYKEVLKAEEEETQNYLKVHAALSTSKKMDQDLYNT